jgi:hypothetical protein
MKRRVKIVFILFVLVAIVVLGFKVTDLQKQLDSAKSNQNQVQTLLAGDNNVAGFTCGVLTKQRASSLLTVSEELKQAYVQGPSNIIQSGQPAQNNIFWSDSCRYEDVADNSKYIEFFITTFQTTDLAQEAFPDFFGAVNDAVALSAEGYGDELRYEGGAYYLLRGSRVIQIAASNGVPSQTESFSRSAFDSILANL